MFERSLDPAARARSGAYYTRREDIHLLVEPVLMAPLRRCWEHIQQTVNDKPDCCSLHCRRASLLDRLRTITVLDPACGSGNFLYVALQSLMDMEWAVIQSPVWRDLPTETPRVHPRQMLGIEKDPDAHDLARRVLWMGYARWHDDHGFPVEEQPETIQIQLKDAILGLADDGTPYHPDWPVCDVILSNPPFLGSRKLRIELGAVYVDHLKELFGDAFGSRTPDLVCYWFERARQELAAGKTQRVGLLATNSIRGGTNRRVLARIAQTGRIFMAWSEREWQNEDAGVNVSVVAFDGGAETAITLNGQPVTHINPDLTAGRVDLTLAERLPENSHLAFQGIIKRGPFDLSRDKAQAMLDSDPANADVIRPIFNGKDITYSPRDRWVIDFGEMPLEQARNYKLPFAYAEKHVQPVRQCANQPEARDRWWRHWNPRPEMRQMLAPLNRYVATPAVSKHRVFVWLDRCIHPDHALIVFAREDDYFFGVLHSRIHAVWALRMGTSLEDRPRYTPTTTLETFPFPWIPGQEPPNHPAYLAISTAARQLNDARENWLLEDHQPPEKHTLTHLYNALLVYRGESTGKTIPDAVDFAPQLDQRHRALDRAVCEAYGWPYDILTDDEAILERLLMLNRERSVLSR